MFTGLIQAVGAFDSKSISGHSGDFTVQAAFSDSPLEIGESIAVNGTCLTVTRFDAETVTFHVMAETLSRTNLGNARQGTPLNLERALRLGDRLGGHLVSGHVDGTTLVQAIGKNKDGDTELTLELPAALAPYVILKGSIAINGVSLTIAKLDSSSFSVCIIPHTWSHTNLCNLRKGDAVNLETDLFGKYILRKHELDNPKNSTASHVTLDMLDKAGFF